MTEDQQADDAGDPALGALRLAWGDFYAFGYDQRGYWARRIDGKGQDMVAREPEDLQKEVAADFEYARPAPARPAAAGGLPPAADFLPPFGARR